MKDFFAFRSMLTPVLIILIYWILTLSCIAGGVYVLVAGDDATAQMTDVVKKMSDHAGQDVKADAIAPRHTKLIGILMIVIGPIVVRIWCETLILFFRMNGTLTEIMHNTTPSKPKETKPSE